MASTGAAERVPPAATGSRNTSLKRRAFASGVLGHPGGPRFGFLDSLLNLNQTQWIPKQEHGLPIAIRLPLALSIPRKRTHTQLFNNL